MKLFRKLLVAPAALGLLAPMAANATELNINGVSDYTATGEQVTSITQFSDVYPTDWAYQALSNLIERYGCVAGYPNGTYRGNRAMTRFEAAALLNACLDRVTEVTDELKRLMKEFEKELAILKGRVDGLEARVGELEATQFSTTTTLKGKSTFVIGATNASGDGSDDYNGAFGATTFNYDQRLILNTSFTGKDKLLTRLRAGNFRRGKNAFAGSGVNLAALDVATDSGAVDSNLSNNIIVDRLYYKFPVGDQITLIAGAVARNTESLALWPSMYNKGGAKILDWTALMGTSGVYNKETGQLIGGYWRQKVDKGANAFSVSVNYVADDKDGNVSDPGAGGFMTANSEASLLAQLGYAGPRWGVAFGYRYGQCDSGNGFRRGTSFARNDKWNNECFYEDSNGDKKRSGSSTNSYALNAYWQPEEAGFIPSISLGWGLNTVSTANKQDGTPIQTQSWMAGLKWNDVFLKGNDLGFAVGQPTFATSLKGGDTPFDGNYVLELYYNFQVTDNIAITPAIFYLSRPEGQDTQSLVKNGSGYDGQFNVLGALVQTTIKF